MKLSPNTVNILKNCASINPGIVIQGGNKLSTLSVMRNIFVNATVEENLPKCAFYNLSEFLSVLSLFKEPELDFQDKFVYVGSGRSRVKYAYSDPTVIIAPTKEINAPQMDITFELSAEALSELLKGAAVLQLPDVVVSNEEGKLTVTALDLKNPSSNRLVYDVDAEELPEATFSMIFRSELLQKLRQGSYKVEISQKRISRWTQKDVDLSYFVSLEASSKFGG